MIQQGNRHGRHSGVRSIISSITASQPRHSNLHRYRGKGTHQAVGPILAPLNKSEKFIQNQVAKTLPAGQSIPDHSTNSPSHGLAAVPKSATHHTEAHRKRILESLKDNLDIKKRIKPDRNNS